MAKTATPVPTTTPNPPPVSLEQQVFDLREKITDTQARLEAATAADVPRDEFIARVNSWIDAQQREFDERAVYQVSALRLARPEPQNVAILQGTVRGAGSASLDVVAFADMGPLIAGLFGAELKARLAALIDATDYPEGPPTADRAHLQLTLRNELDALELREETLIVEAEAAGLTIHRRPDCRPEIVLSLKLAR
jgi:hypothetical protein